MYWYEGPPTPGTILFMTLFILSFGVAAWVYGLKDGDLKGMLVGLVLVVVAIGYGIAATVVHLA